MIGFVRKAVLRAQLEAEQRSAAMWEARSHNLAIESEAQQARYDALLEKYHAVVERATSPTPATPAAEFKDFPPIVAAAIAIATAGLPKDIARATRVRARAMLDEGTKPDEVAAAVRRGERIPDHGMAD